MQAVCGTGPSSRGDENHKTLPVSSRQFTLSYELLRKFINHTRQELRAKLTSHIILNQFDDLIKRKFGDMDLMYHVSIPEKLEAQNLACATHTQAHKPEEYA